MEVGAAELVPFPLAGDLEVFPAAGGVFFMYRGFFMIGPKLVFPSWKAMRRSGAPGHSISSLKNNMKGVNTQVKS